MRIEVDGGAEVRPDAPTVDSGSGGPPKWVIGLGILIVGIVGAVFLLRPAEDTAADGSARQAPTTTIAEEESSNSEPVSAELDPAESIPLTPLVLDGRVSEIIAGDFGFFALTVAAGGFEESVSPRLLRSVDGEDWFEINTSVSQTEGAGNRGRNWFNLAPRGDSLVVTATNLDSLNQFFPSTSVFVSEAGSEWSELEQFDELAQADGSSQVLPIVVNDSSAFGVEFAQFEALNDFVAQHTNIEIPPLGFCGAQPSDPARVVNESYQIFRCEDGLTEVIDESRIVSEFSRQEVFLCLDRAGSVGSSGASLNLVRLDLGENSDRIELGGISPRGLPRGLANGGIAGIEEGRSEQTFGECAGLIPPRETFEPALFIADETSDQVQRWPLPEEILPVNRSEPGISGEVTVAGEDLLVVNTTNALWTLDTETGEWSIPLTSSGTPLQQRAFRFSESRTRAYSITSESTLVTFDFVEGADGELEIIETSQAISTEGLPPLNLDFVGTIYADDEVLFLNDGIEAWSLEAPPLPN